MANKTTKSKICPECGAGNTYTKVSGVVVCRTCGWQSEEGAMLKMKGPAPAGPSRMSKWFQELTNTSFVNLNSFKSINATFEFISDISTKHLSSNKAEIIPKAPDPQHKSKIVFLSLINSCR